MASQQQSRQHFHWHSAASDAHNYNIKQKYIKSNDNQPAATEAATAVVAMCWATALASCSWGRNSTVSGDSNQAA